MAGAKAPKSFGETLVARLKPCRYYKAREMGRVRSESWQGLKPRLLLRRLSARLKSCPVTKPLKPCGATEVVPCYAAPQAKRVVAKTK